MKPDFNGTKIFYKLGCVILILTAGTLLNACAPDVVQHNNAGNQNFDQGDYEAAIAKYRQAQVDAPDQAEPYYNAANAYNRQGQVEAVQAQVQQALKTADPDLAAQAWYNLGNAYFDAQQWTPAIAAYQEALRLHPDDLDAKHNLELALQKHKEQQENQEQQDEENQEQQDQENQEQDQENQEDQQSQNDEQGQEDQATPTPAGQPETSENRDQATPEPSGQAEGMTPEQAMQLLQALVGDSETLQERLQEIYRAPGPAPEQDW